MFKQKEILKRLLMIETQMDHVLHNMNQQESKMSDLSDDIQEIFRRLELILEKNEESQEEKDKLKDMLKKVLDKKEEPKFDLKALKDILKVAMDEYKQEMCAPKPKKAEKKK